METTGKFKETKICCSRGNAGKFLTQILLIAQILWEERHLSAPFLLFFLANPKRQRRKGFYGRSGIFPLHFCYFFLQTQSANGATELAQGASPG